MPPSPVPHRAPLPWLPGAAAPGGSTASPCFGLAGCAGPGTRPWTRQRPSSSGDSDSRPTGAWTSPGPPGTGECATGHGPATCTGRTSSIGAATSRAASSGPGCGWRTGWPSTPPTSSTASSAGRRGGEGGGDGRSSGQNPIWRPGLRRDGRHGIRQGLPSPTPTRTRHPLQRPRQRGGAAALG